MLGAIHEGGWPMYVIIGLGVASLVAAWRYSHEGRKELLGGAIGLAAATLFAGMFGTIAGFMHSVEYIRDVPPDDRWIVVIGLKESLNCFEASLLFALAASLLMTRGFWRRARLAPAHNS